MNCLLKCTDPDLAVDACHFDARPDPGKLLRLDHPRCLRRESEATALTRVQLSFLAHSRDASRERPATRAARTSCACAVCDSSFSRARLDCNFGIAPSVAASIGKRKQAVRMPRRSQNAGELFTPALSSSIPYACCGLKAQTQKANCPD